MGLHERVVRRVYCTLHYSVGHISVEEAWCKQQINCSFSPFSASGVSHCTGSIHHPCVAQGAPGRLPQAAVGQAFQGPTRPIAARLLHGVEPFLRFFHGCATAATEHGTCGDESGEWEARAGETTGDFRTCNLVPRLPSCHFFCF